MTTTYAGVMFDLDGTLADTLDDIAASANHALAALGREPIPTPRYRYLAGQGLRYLVEHALGPDLADPETVERGMALFREHYAEHDADHTRPFPGIPGLLTDLKGRGLKLTVLSNKPDEATRRVVPALLGDQFDAVLGARDDLPLKPDPAGALHLCERLGIPPARWLYVGDTRVDMLTARAAGMFACGVLWGFRDEDELRESGAEAIIERPEQLLGLL